MINLGKKASFYAFLTALVLFTGCSQKSVEVDAGEQAQKEAAERVDKAGPESSLDKLDRIGTSTTMGVGGAMEGEESTYGVKNVYFAFDKYNLTEPMRDIAKSNAAILATMDGKIKLEGNCDEWGTDEYNYALGLKRAKTAKDALIADGISSSRIIMVSYGESNPVCTEHNIPCWKKNRRVEYKLLP